MERMTARGGEVRGGRIEQKGKRTHGHGQEYGDCREGRGYKEIKW